MFRDGRDIESMESHVEPQKMRARGTEGVVTPEMSQKVLPRAHLAALGFTGDLNHSTGTDRGRSSAVQTALGSPYGIPGALKRDDLSSRQKRASTLWMSSQTLHTV